MRGSSFTSSVSGTCFTNTNIFIKLLLSGVNILVSGKNSSADDHAQDLGAAFHDAPAASITDETLDVVLLAVAVAAEYLLSLNADLDLSLIHI